MKKPDHEVEQSPIAEIRELSIQMPAIRPVINQPAEGRNAPCPCGSGKKYKKCHDAPPQIDSKPRQEKITLRPAAPISFRAGDTPQLVVMLDPFSRNIGVEGEGGQIPLDQVGIERNYYRAKGEKVNTTALVDGGAPHFDLVRALSPYDLCIAVDSNTDNIDGVRITVTGTTTFAPAELLTLEPKIGPGFALELRASRAPSEKYGWHWTLFNFMRSPQFDSAKRYCLIVDAHLGELRAINDRKLPYYRDHKLPEQFDIVYASADVGDDLRNVMIRRADWCATAVLAFIRSGTEFSQLEMGADEISDARRLWDLQSLANNGALKLT